MVKPIDLRMLWLAFLSGVCPIILTGCPGLGDRFRYDETTQVNKKGNDVCFIINDAQDYQSIDMGINLRGIPPKEKNYNFSPNLEVAEGELCISPSYYHFNNGNKYIVEFVLHSARSNKAPGSFTVGVGVNNNQVYNFPLSDREFARPYGAIRVPE